MLNIAPSHLLAPRSGGLSQMPSTAAPVEETPIKPIADARDPEARLREGQAPSQFWSAANGEPDPTSNIAPPSILQITISRLLDAQRPDPLVSADDTPDATDTEAPKISGDTPPSDDPRLNLHQTDRKPPDSQASDDLQSADGANDARNSVFSTLP